MLNREYEDLCVAYEMLIQEQGYEQQAVREFCKVCGPHRYVEVELPEDRIAEDDLPPAED